jgi:hypothetical protein
MVDKIDAARQAKPVIVLKEDSAQPVKQAIEKISKIISIEGNEVAFEGRRIVEGHGYALIVDSFDVFQCPNGYLLHTYMRNAPNWAVAGRTIFEMLDAAPDQTVAKRAHGLLIQKNLIAGHH